MAALAATTLPLAKADGAIKGGIELHERMPPLDPTLGAGNIFDKEVVMALLEKYRDRDDYFYRMPKWLKGTWTMKQATRISSKNEKTGDIDTSQSTYVCESNESYGWRSDRSGNLWDFNEPGYLSETKFGDGLKSYYFVCNYAAMEKDECLSSRTSGVSIDVDATGKITDASWREQLSIYSKLSPSIFHSRALIRSFGGNGELTSSSEHVSNHKLISQSDNYSVFDSKDRLLLPRFNEYLSKRGLAALAPDSTAGDRWGVTLLQMQKQHKVKEAGLEKYLFSHTNEVIAEMKKNQFSKAVIKPKTRNWEAIEKAISEKAGR